MGDFDQGIEKISTKNFCNNYNLISSENLPAFETPKCHPALILFLLAGPKLSKLLCY